MRPIITDSFSFPLFREKNAIYVDKTAQLHRLITSPESSNFFISRPRRFGKSLMISTLEAIFKGQRDLFRGLAIDSLDYDWEIYPVLRFSFSGVPIDSTEIFESNFAATVSMVLEDFDIPYHPEWAPGINFANAIRKLYKRHGQKVVVLVDEYDAPVGHSLADVEKAEKIRDILSDFYQQIKEMNELIHFMIMTGVSKFTQLSVFSALNHLRDLTIEPDSADLLGYTETELETYFNEHMRAHAATMGIPYEDYRAQLRRWSDGYRFSPDSETRMYNPYAIANTLLKQLPEFRSTWSTTGRPSFLVNYFNKEAFVNQDWENVDDVTSAIFDTVDLRALEPTTVLYQAGYLTIKESRGLSFTLGIPNQEIRQDINSLLLDLQASGKRTLQRDRIGTALAQHEFDKFEERVRAFYAGLPYGSREAEIRQSEFSYARIFNALLQGAGFELRPEDTQTCGRPDLVAKDPHGTYIFEFKVDASAQAALTQIQTKGYAAPFRDRALPIFAFGINFDSTTARINDFLMETLA